MSGWRKEVRSARRRLAKSETRKEARKRIAWKSRYMFLDGLRSIVKMWAVSSTRGTVGWRKRFLEWAQTSTDTCLKNDRCWVRQKGGRLRF